jgi:TatD DNase family protein
VPIDASRWLMLVDTHVHLNSPDFDADRIEVLERAHNAGVHRFLCPGYDIPSSRAAVELAASNTSVVAAVGIHPHDSKDLDRAAEAELESMLGAPRVVAIGETGLDYHYDHSPRQAQRASFVRHLQMARRRSLPVVVHNRESDEDMRRILDDEGDGMRIVLHAFGGAPRLAQLAGTQVVFFGVGGFLTFKNHRLSQLVADLPRQSLLLETDAPYLSPHPLRGRRNEPAHVEIVARRLAELLRVSVEEVAELTTRNFARFVGEAPDAASDEAAH